MEQRARVLVVTDRGEATPELVHALRERAARGPATFRVLVPNPAPAEWHPFHPERHDKADEAERVLLRALPQIQDAVDDAVRGRVSIRHDPMAAIEEMLLDEPFDEIILAVETRPLARRLHADLPHRLAHLGLPVTSVIQTRAQRGGRFRLR
jgi:hypothetical protein